MMVKGKTCEINLTLSSGKTSLQKQKQGMNKKAHAGKSGGLLR